MLHRGIAEQHKRSLSELDDNMGIASRHALAGAKIERNVGPAPVVDEHLHGDESLGPGIGRNIAFGTVCGSMFATRCAVPVLPAHGAAENFLIADRLDE